MTTVGNRTADHPIDPLFLERWSPRAFSGEAIPVAELMSIFEAARWALTYLFAATRAITMSTSGANNRRTINTANPASRQTDSYGACAPRCRTFGCFSPKGWSRL